MRRHNLIKQGRSPLKNIGIGALGGIGVGALIDFVLNNKKREAQNYRWWKRPLIYAALGSIPGLLQAGAHYRHAKYDDSHLENIGGGLDSSLGILDPLLMTDEELKKASPVYKSNIETMINNYRLDHAYDNFDDLPEQEQRALMGKSASLYKRALGWNTPNIPLGMMNNSLNTTPGILPGTVNNMSNLFMATQNATGMPTVSPAQVAGTLANAGVGYATGAVIGKTIGALCGLSPQAYDTIKNMGMYAGMMNTMSNGINKF